MRLALALAFSMIAAVAVAGDVYRWKDSSGRIIYSDAPPPGVDARKMTSDTPASGNPEPRRSLAEKEAEFRKRRTEGQAAEEKSAKEKADADQRAKACSDAKNQLAALQSGQRMIRYTDTGERVFLDDQEREAATRDAQKAVQNWCK